MPQNSTEYSGAPLVSIRGGRTIFPPSHTGHLSPRDPDIMPISEGGKHYSHAVFRAIYQLSSSSTPVAAHSVMFVIHNRSLHALFGYPAAYMVITVGQFVASCGVSHAGTNKRRYETGLRWILPSFVQGFPISLTNRAVCRHLRLKKDEERQG